MWDASGGKRIMPRSKCKIEVVPVFKYFFFAVAQQRTSDLGHLIVEVSRLHTRKQPVGHL